MPNVATHTSLRGLKRCHQGADRMFVWVAADRLLPCLQGDKSYAAFLFTYGQQQVNYMLGDAGRSFVVGFGNNPPNMPFHKW